jgi:AraC family transcriptional regulator
MGQHAFPDEPQHVVLYRERAPEGRIMVMGVDESWNVPVARNAATFAGDCAFPGVDHYTLTLHLSGPPIQRLDAPGGRARRGALSLQVPDSGIVLRAETFEHIAYAHLYIRQSLLDEAGAALNQGRDSLRDFFGRTDMGCNQDVAIYVARTADTADPPSALEMDSRAYLIVLGLLKHANGLSPQGEGVRNYISGPRLTKVLKLIDERMSDALRLSDLASAAGLSPFHFARSFKEQMGETPSRYLMRRRTERARELLQNTSLAISEIALRTGFSSQAHMTTRFRKAYGLTPSRFR